MTTGIKYDIDKIGHKLISTDHYRRRMISEILYWFYVNTSSVRSIAERLGISIATVKRVIKSEGEEDISVRLVKILNAYREFGNPEDRNQLEDMNRIYYFKMLKEYTDYIDNDEKYPGSAMAYEERINWDELWFRRDAIMNIIKEDDPVTPIVKDNNTHDYVIEDETLKRLKPSWVLYKSNDKYNAIYNYIWDRLEDKTCLIGLPLYNFIFAYDFVNEVLKNSDAKYYKKYLNRAAETLGVHSTSVNLLVNKAFPDEFWELFFEYMLRKV